ncbi:epoxyqueuosine reductase [Candidatus Bathycorpusculum sp.]|jgi:epoxyqueuosine reductase QueG|uniref:epoxyqueuosine reductase n=1 Tax=Candidatus Bathycorpusculum sp. TaxID=2994959 RepID=UPI00282F4AB7|nr:epoxyqueuosine reductase [Candidatus Termitimicrobium sp.]MCL2685534.1 epoxyqueuosine reductase [Candidatus Termitimicrobium sp.]
MAKPKKVLNSEIVKTFGLNAGASVVGIAASKDFGLAPQGFKPSDHLAGCLSVIVLGASFSQEALRNSAEYTAHRKVMIEKINGIAKDVAKQIKTAGYKARDISGFGGKWVNGKQFGLISLKHAAELAGLGLINRNYLLTHPVYGNLLWFSAVLTDAELTPDKKIQDIVCDNCNKCVELCPSKALATPDLFGKSECAGMCFKLVNAKWEVSCYVCRKICPHRFGK